MEPSKYRCLFASPALAAVVQVAAGIVLVALGMIIWRIRK